MRRSVLVAAFAAALMIPMGAQPALAESAGVRPITRTPRQASDVIVRPGDDAAAIVAAAPAGATIRFEAGTYRMVQLVPRDDQRLIAEPGVVLKGSKVLTGWVASGGRWYVTGQTQGSSSPTQGSEWGYCSTGSECVYPEELFVDGARRRRVTSLSSVTAGTWYFDYSADRIYVGDDPSGRTVETSVSRNAISGSANRVRVEGFTITQYAVPGRQGAINPRVGRAGRAGSAWVVVGNTVTFNHGWGIKLEHNLIVTDNVVSDNGQGGLGGVANDIQVVHNEIDRNCAINFKCIGWEGGALKIDSDRFRLAWNLVEDNYGHGLHPDIDSSVGTIEWNVVDGNEGAGIHYETSTGGLIRNNTVTNNGFLRSGAREPGILVLNSPNTKVLNNTVSGNANGIMVRQDTRTSRGIINNVVVSNNVVTIGAGARTGVGNTNGVTIGSVSFTGNSYNYTESRPFVWKGTTETESQWRARGFDTTGVFNRL